MGYLKTDVAEVDGHTFKICELSYADYREVNKAEDDGALIAVCRGVLEFHDDDPESVAKKLSASMVAALAVKILNISAPEDAEGNSESALAEDSYSD